MSVYRKNAKTLAEEYEKSVLEESEKQKAEVDKQADMLIAKAEDEVKTETASLDNAYRDTIDTIAIQRELDRRQIAETMANMGLTRSGLSATQQTAVQLSAGNKTAAAQLKRQEAVDALTKSLAEYKMAQETSRATQKNAIDASAKQGIADYSSEVYKAANEADAAAQQATIKAATAAEETRRKTLEKLLDSGTIDAATYTAALEQGWSPSAALQQSSNDNVTENISPTIPEDVVNHIRGNIRSEGDLETYLDSITGKVITEKQADYLYSTYKNFLNMLDTSKWTKQSHGGVNGFLGLGKWLGNIDNNASASYGDKEYTMEELSNYLQEQGLNAREAKAFVVKLQKELGVH